MTVPLGKKEPVGERAGIANNADNGFICAWRYSQAPKHTDSHSIIGLLSCFIYQPLGAVLGSHTAIYLLP